ncbi:MAG: hypothetical protein QXI19_14630 [Candidatus Caldarchaeum sp.]
MNGVCWFGCPSQAAIPGDEAGEEDSAFLKPVSRSAEVVEVCKQAIRIKPDDATEHAAGKWDIGEMRIRFYPVAVHYPQKSGDKFSR